MFWLFRHTFWCTLTKNFVVAGVDRDSASCSTYIKGLNVRSTNCCLTKCGATPQTDAYRASIFARELDTGATRPKKQVRSNDDTRHEYASTPLASRAREIKSCVQTAHTSHYCESFRGRELAADIRNALPKRTICHAGGETRRVVRASSSFLARIDARDSFIGPVSRFTATNEGEDEPSFDTLCNSACCTI